MVVVGRRRELATLTAGLQAAASGQGALLLLEGHAGLGKSRLVGEAAEQAVSLGLPAFVGAAEELERGQPWAALAAALKSGPDPTGALSAFRAALRQPARPEHDRPLLLAGAGGTSWQLIDRAVTLLEEQVGTSGALLAVDDAQWADPLSLAALLALGRRTAQLPVCLLVAFRPAPPSPELSRFLEAAEQVAGARTLVLDPLQEAEVAELAAVTLGSPPGPAVTTRLREAGGNPFLVLELLAELTGRAAGSIEPAVRGEDLPEEVPGRLRRVILRRLRTLDRSTVSVLRTAAVLQVFDFDQLAAVTGQPAPALVAPLQQALEAGLLVDHGECFGFRYDLVRQALYQDTSPGLRASLHLSAGRALARTGGRAATVAEHLATVARPGDTDAAIWLQRAATEVGRDAPGMAAELLTRALGILGAGRPDAEFRSAVVADLVEVLGWAGRAEEAEQTALAELPTVHGRPVELRLRWGLALARFLRGGARAAAEELERIARTPGLPPEEWGRTIAELALARLSAGDLPGARDAARKGLDEAVHDDAVAVTVARTVLAMLTGFSGRSRAATRLSAAAVSAADDDLRVARGNRAHRYHPLFFHGLLLTDADDHAGADEALRRGRELNDELGTPWAAPLYHGAGATRSYRAGAWDDAVAEAEAGLGAGQEAGSRIAPIWAHAVLAVISVRRGRLDAAHTHLRAAARDGDPDGLQFGSDLLLLAEALLHEAEHRRGAAIATLTAGWDVVTALGQHVICPTFGPPLVRLALAEGDHARAADVVAVLDGLARTEERPGLTGAALHCRGLLHRDAEAHLAAVEAYRDSPRRVETAEAAEDAARALHRGRRRPAEAARRLLEEALAVYRQVGIGPATARVERLLGGAPRAARPLVGWDALTPTERSIVDLVREGYSNGRIAERLVVSRRTVESHLYHVFTKVGVTSRLELVVEAGRHVPGRA
jgi:DNA-binding CsgD family transcriptional regulator